MRLIGVEGLTTQEVEEEVRRGGKFVIFQYCVSPLIVTFRESSDIYFIRAGEGTFSQSAEYTFLSLLCGWWGIPWGLIYTPAVLFTNLTGGKDVTREVLLCLPSEGAPEECDVPLT